MHTTHVYNLEQKPYLKKFPNHASCLFQNSFPPLFRLAGYETPNRAVESTDCNMRCRHACRDSVHTHRLKLGSTAQVIWSAEQPPSSVAHYRSGWKMTAQQPGAVGELPIGSSVGTVNSRFYRRQSRRRGCAHS
ncbi:hypothetical protein MRX96_013620 [Rhipicephalus microplus]